jgi:hypothetical protein
MCILHNMLHIMYVCPYWQSIRFVIFFYIFVSFAHELIFGYLQSIRKCIVSSSVTFGTYNIALTNVIFVYWKNTGAANCRWLFNKNKLK